MNAPRDEWDETLRYAAECMGVAPTPAVEAARHRHDLFAGDVVDDASSEPLSAGFYAPIPPPSKPPTLFSYAESQERAARARARNQLMQRRSMKITPYEAGEVGDADYGRPR